MKSLNVESAQKVADKICQGNRVGASIALREAAQVSVFVANMIIYENMSRTISAQGDFHICAKNFMYLYAGE